MYWPDEILRHICTYIPSKLDKIQQKYPYCLNINCGKRITFYKYKSTVDFHMAKCNKCHSGIYVSNDI